MTTEQRYVVKLASGHYLGDASAGTFGVREIRYAARLTRQQAYDHASRRPGAVALRLKPSKRAAELAKLRAEVDALRDACCHLRSERDNVREYVEGQLADVTRERDEWKAQASRSEDHMEDLRAKCAQYRVYSIDAERKLDAMTAERDAERKAANEAIATAHDMTKERDALAAELVLAQESIRLLRACPLPPARPVEELRDELRNIWQATDYPAEWDAVARRARELGAR
jgi:chromosome segregation ATPase